MHDCVPKAKLPAMFSCRSRYRHPSRRGALVLFYLYGFTQGVNLGASQYLVCGEGTGRCAHAPRSDGQSGIRSAMPHHGGALRLSVAPCDGSLTEQAEDYFAGTASFFGAEVASLAT